MFPSSFKDKFKDWFKDKSVPEKITLQHPSSLSANSEESQITGKLITLNSWHWSSFTLNSRISLKLLLALTLAPNGQTDLFKPLFHRILQIRETGFHIWYRPISTSPLPCSPGALLLWRVNIFGSLNSSSHMLLSTSYQFYCLSISSLSKTLRNSQDSPSVFYFLRYINIYS